ncbi:MAG: radical SAM protein, partial [Betaproteobacteria bacterium]
MQTHGADAPAGSPAVAPVLPAPRKGRGAVANLPHRFESLQREVDGDALDHALREDGADLPPLPTTVMHERVKSLLAYNESPDIPFDRSINPYRGCEHGCIYCYARPTHSYLNLSPGLDFETRILAKTNAAELLRKDLSKPGYQPQSINIGSVTDAYQPAEKHWRITRSVIEVLAEFQHAFSVITKSSLIERDLDLIAPMAQRGLVATYVSIT